MKKEDVKILIVDDTPEDIDILSGLLSDCDLTAAINGETALQIVKETKPDLILLDIMMPGLDGYEVAERLKKDKATGDIPIIFLTAKTDTASVVKGLEMGANDYITKPFQAEEVLSRIRTHLKLSFYEKRLKNINQELKEKVDERTNELLIEKDKALEACKLKSHFLALMSHELRTPMTGILGFSEILESEIQDKELKNIAGDLHSAAERLRDTLSSILDLSKLESDKLKSHQVNLDIVSRINKLLIMHQLNASNKGLEMSFDIEPGTFISKIDPEMFDVIINNILVNAVKFTKKGSVNIRVYSADGFNRICVKDTGIGVPEEKHEIIFEEFRQVDEGLKRNFDGVGLGLSIVKKYVELQDGHIIFESEVNKGTSFTIAFPELKKRVFEKTDKAEDLAKKKEFYLKEKIKLLLVEDDPMNIKVASLFLKDYADVDTALSGEEGLQLAKENDYAAILMDINLGEGATGLATTKEIKKMDKYKKTPVIAYTAFAMEGDKESFLQEGCTHYLPKPCSKIEMQHTLLNILT